MLRLYFMRMAFEKSLTVYKNAYHYIQYLVINFVPFLQKNL